MARTGQYILDGAWIIAQDNGATPGIRWTTAEGLRWINDVQVEIVQMLPRANAKRATPTVVAGTRQTLTGLGLTDGITFIDVVRNFAINGTTAGSAISKRERAWFDDSLPAWHSATGTEVEHWMADENDPKAIYIYPAVTGANGKLEVIYSGMPTDLAAIGDAIGLDDIYANALMYGVLSRFYMKDATYGKNPQVATSFYALMGQSLGLRAQNITAQAASATKRAAGA